MALAVIVPTILANSDQSKAITFTAITGASQSDTIAVSKKDLKGLIIINNTDPTYAATTIFSTGDGVRAGAGTVTIAIAAATQVIVPLERLETARVLNMTGTNKGKIVMNTTIATSGTITLVKFAFIERV
jgi:hypothetical protein